MIAPHPSLVFLPDHRPGQLNDEATPFRHRLAGHELFSDESLAHIIDTHPREFRTVSTMGSDHTRYEWGEGDTTGLNGEQLVHAVRHGRMRLTIRGLERYQPRVWRLVVEVYRELEAACPGLITTKHTGNLVVSSPTAFDHYHLDVGQNILWHLRGRNRVWVYPAAAPYLDRETLEDTVAGQRKDALPYDAEFDAGAHVFDMEPGDALTWPQNSPYRVENVEGLNVSLSTEHYTHAQLRHVRVCRANALLRKSLNIRCRSMKTDGLAYALKSSAFLGMRAVQKLMCRRESSSGRPMTFRVDPAAPNCIRPLAVAEN